MRLLVGHDASESDKDLGMKQLPANSTHEKKLEFAVRCFVTRAEACPQEKLPETPETVDDDDEDNSSASGGMDDLVALSDGEIEYY